ncbi:MAG: hypothetical protein J7L47_05600 [Candidatus Odinarchaeota archaeon]|nr:hypothetical protein [Candidatus Odinarchaeota archaeon]
MQKVIEERPMKNELKYLLSKYQNPKTRNIEWDLRFIENDYTEPMYKGVVVILLFTHQGLAMIRPKTVPDAPERYTLPIDKISLAEYVEDAVTRVGIEKIGFNIYPISLPAIHRIFINFANITVIRWHFIFRVKILGGNVTHNDSKPNAVRFFTKIPSYKTIPDKDWVPLVLRDAGLLRFLHGVSPKKL